MSLVPPAHPRSRPSSRRLAPGRPAALLVAVFAVAAAACATPTRPPSSVVGVSATPSASSTGPRVDADGLLVAAGGALQVTERGVLVPFDGPDGVSVEVVAAREDVIAVDADGGMSRSERPAAGARRWTAVTIAPGPHPNPRLLGLSPAGTTLALANGELQARSFRLVLVDLAGGATRSIDVPRGLDGPPVWVGPAVVAVHAIRDDQTSGFTEIDLATGTVTDVPSYGVALAATTDGTRVALDEATSGDVLVGQRSDVNDNGIASMARLVNPAGGVDRIALSGDGTRLAIARRTDAGTTIELHVLADGGWRAAGTIAIQGDRTVSMAWLE